MRLVIASVFLFLVAHAAHAGTITVSAAVSLKESLTTIAAAYERDHAEKVVLNFGATGHLLAQIREGAPVDVFIAASDEQMDQAELQKLVDPATRRVIAGNSLVLIVPGSSRLDISSFADLVRPELKRIAIGQPKTVPAGEYASQALRHLRLDDAVRDRVVYGASVRQVLDYVERGEVDAGIVYATDARQSQGKTRIVATAEAAWHRPIRYVAAVVSTSPNREAAARLLAHLATPAAQKMLSSEGFAPAPAPADAARKPSLWPPLMLSLKVALAATVVVVIVGIPLAYAMARKTFAGRSILEAILVVPLVLPPTVVGYLILIAVGTRSSIGRILDGVFGYSVLFNWHGAVLASAIVALPLLYLPAKSAFASVEREMEDIARLMGANRLQVFWHVALPLARRGIASGLMLCFARALGEFGATIMVMGDLPGRQTLPISIYNDYVAGDLARAWPGVIALSAISLGVIFFYNRSTLGGRE
ncbi:MAG: molybdate transport system permease protein [Phycisphaerales bacterium]|jgi:molybdate ABC transporter permease protein/molybdenum ABC transporter molybdate-binding protein|nr:molybdate transport system permease protein [Phycisphaerales bacterium]